MQKIDLVFGIVFFIVMFIFILTPDKFAKSFDDDFVPGFLIFQNTKYPNTNLNSFIFLLKLLLYTSFPIVLLSLKFKDNEALQLLNLTFLPFVILINIIGLPCLSYGLSASKSVIYNLNSFGFNIVLILISLLVVHFISTIFKTKDTKIFKNLNNWLRAELILILCFLLALPNISFGFFFGRSYIRHVGFAPMHIVIIVFSVIFPIIISLILKRYFKNNSGEIFLHLISLSLFITFFDWYDFDSFYDLSIWPINLCNIAVPILLVSIWLKQKHLFYFCYFANVVGAFFAIILPGITNDVSITSPLGVHFWYEHAGVFIVPLIAVNINYFKRPTLCDYINQGFIFTIYFILISIVNILLPSITNANFINADKVDYLFLNGSDLADYIKILEIVRNNYDIKLLVNSVIVHWYVIHNILIYIGFLAATSYLLVIYKISYLLTDLFKKISKKKLKNRFIK